MMSDRRNTGHKIHLSHIRFQSSGGSYRHPFLISFLFFQIIIFFLLPAGISEAESDIIPIAVNYCAVDCDSRPIMAEYSDDWLFNDPLIFNHKLLQASFVMAASAFRDKTQALEYRDFNILNFFDRAGFIEPRTDDYNKITSIDTIGSAIAHKKVGDTTLIAAAISGNNYQNEWMSNFTISDQERMQGFNDASGRVLERIRNYISEQSLTGHLRLWITGYSRAAAVANITAADATDSGLFEAVYGYTIATPRTTKDPAPDRYRNIFNVINPFDPVPLIPFPEWGYDRYGIDFYLPAMETDSHYFDKIDQADSVSEKITGNPVRFNPQINMQLHTILDFLLFFIHSANSYSGTLQNIFIEFWENRDLHILSDKISDYLNLLSDATFSQLKEFYYFLDYLCEVVYTSFRGQKFHASDVFWNPGLSLQENVMHEHYDSAYLSWIFSTDDPALIFSEVPKYFHYTILGDVNVEIFDGSGDFVGRIEYNGEIKEDLADVQTSDFSGKPSDVQIYSQRDGKQTFIILPEDQTFSVKVFSTKNQSIRFSLVEYSVDAIQAAECYVYSREMKKNDVSEGLLDMAVLRDLSVSDLSKYGFIAEQPWGNDTAYSPSAIMNLENNDIFHPSPLFFLTSSGLLLIFAIYLMFLNIAGTAKGIRFGVKKIRSYKTDRKDANTVSNRAKIEQRNSQERILLEDKTNEDK